MTTSTKAVAGIGGLLATATVPSAYLTISSSSSKGDSTSEVETRTTGETWLSNNGYKPNKPTFKTQDSLRHGCSENLFSNTKNNSDPTNDSRLYGCAVMSMDLGNTGVTFHGRDPKYIKFNSEIAIRKGNEGWVINARVDNWSDYLTDFDYILTSYKWTDNNWKQGENPKLWSDPVTMSANPELLELIQSPTENQNAKITESINVHGQRLVIKTPEGSWWDGKDWISPSDTTKTKKEKRLQTKHWAGAWVHDEGEKEDSWIFKDIELYMIDKKYSQVFCKGDDNCFQKSPGDSNSKTKKTNNLETWSRAYSNKQNTTEKVQEMVTKDIKTIIGKLKDLKGRWMKLGEVCGLKAGEVPNEEKQNQLRMYCSNGKKQEQA